MELDADLASRHGPTLPGGGSVGLVGSFLDFVCDQLPDVTSRAMFGGHGLYRDGVFFAIAYEDRLYFKVDDSTVGRYLEAGMGPFSPRTRTVSRSYYEVPAEVLDDREVLAEWAADALAAAAARSS